MDKTGKKVCTVMAEHKHPKEAYYDSGVPILFEVNKGTKGVKLMGKQIEVNRPRHECPDWADETGEDGGVFKYDRWGDQICQNCGYVRNQDTEDVVADHQHSGRYDGFQTGEGVSD